MSNLPFPTIEHVRNLCLFTGVLLLISEKVGGERVLTSPIITDFGLWGPWEFCPEGFYASGMQLYTHPPQGFFKDDRGLTGIRLFCNKFGKNAESHAITSNTDNVGKWGKSYFCSGIMTGFQLRSEKFQSAFADDTAANNMRMYCDYNEESYQEGDGTSFGSWTDKRVCQPHEAVCGIKAQVEEDKMFSLDQTGLNNIMIRCCDIPHPLQNCDPKTDWAMIALCEASADHDTYCSYTRQVGISYGDNFVDDKPLHETLGYGLTKITTQFQSRFLNASSDVSENEVIREDSINQYWEQAPSYIWEPGTLEKAELKVKKGTNVSLYQVQGTCGALQVRGAIMKIVETDTETKREATTLVDFTSENEIDYSP